MSGNVLGHFPFQPLGGFRVHLIRVTDEGAGAVGLSAHCNGIEPWIRCNSDLTPEEWPDWKLAQAPIKEWPEWSTIKRVDCPRCEATYAKRRARMLKTSGKR